MTTPERPHTAATPQPNHLASNPEQSLADMVPPPSVVQERQFGDHLDALAARYAPDAASAPWSQWDAQLNREPTSQVPGLYRVGTFTIAGCERPILMPAFGQRHLSFAGPNEARGVGDAVGITAGIITRGLAALPAGSLRVSVHGLNGNRQQFSGLEPLARVPVPGSEMRQGKGAHERPSMLYEAVHPNEREALLQSLVGRIQRTLLEGYPSVRARAEILQERLPEPWHVAVLINDGRPFTETEQAAFTYIVEHGTACGVTLITHGIPMAQPYAEQAHLVRGRLETSFARGKDKVMQITPDPSPPIEIMRATALRVAERTKLGVKPPSFESILPRPENYWLENSTEGITAIVGIDAKTGEPVRLELNDLSVHALIGGPTGTGKTNLIEMALASMTTHYSPRELALYLLDFKEGVSFAKYAPNSEGGHWLPHAHLLGVNMNDDREFGLALLNHLTEQIAERSAMFKAAQVSTLQDMRQKHPERELPRMVAIIDEFQILLQGRDAIANEAAALLERLARQGRAAGIHLLLCSQDVSGIDALWGRPSFIDQFGLRIALPGAQRILGPTNTGAEQIPLRPRGFAIVNASKGRPDDNKMVRVPLVPGDTVYDLAGQLWQRGEAESDHRQVPPIVFDGAQRPSFPEATIPRTAGPPQAYLGEGMRVVGRSIRVEVDDTPGANIAVLGTVSAKSKEPLHLIERAVASIAQQKGADVSFSIVYCDPKMAQDAEALYERLAAFNADVVVCDGNAGEELIRESAEAVRTEEVRDTQHYIVLISPEARRAFVDHRTDTTKNLVEVLQRGPQLGTHIIGNWSDVQHLRGSVTAGPAVTDFSVFGTWVAFDVPGADLRKLYDHTLVWSPRSDRALVYSPRTMRSPQLLIPYAPDRAT
jgi:DNA segregation ATPase FtsK/SpoIIIE, S-DNA-T family